MLCELSANVRNDIAALVYSEWCKAYDAVKTAKNLTWADMNQVCPRSDWPVFHAEIVLKAELEQIKWHTAKNEFCKYSPLVAGE